MLRARTRRARRRHGPSGDPVVGGTPVVSGAHMAERTLVIIKPDAVERGLVGEILSRFERKGLTFVAGELRRLERETLGRHYAEHEGKPFYADLVAFMSRSPALVAVV